MRLVAGDRRDALDEVEDARRRVALREHRLDDFHRLNLPRSHGGAGAAVLVGFGDDLPRAARLPRTKRGRGDELAKLPLPVLPRARNEAAYISNGGW